MFSTYRKYEHSKSFGLVTSATSNIVWTSKDKDKSSSTSAGQVVVAANEEVLCWDIKKGELLARWRDENCLSQVTAIAQSKTDPDVFAVGYEDGSIRLWDSKISSVIVNFNGHRSAITNLAFDRSGVRLASGSKDTDIIVWDLVAEVGQYKLRGHKDQVTGLQFVEPQEEVVEEDGGQAMILDQAESPSDGFLLTTGKDSLIKLWDLSTRHCIETHIAQTNGECWALGLTPDFSGCITAGNAGELKVWALDTSALAASQKTVDAPQSKQYLRDQGTLMRQGKDKAIEITFHPRKDYFAVHGSEKAVEIWRIRSESEIKKSLARKKRRRREKLAQKKGEQKTNGETRGDEDEGEEEDQDEGVGRAEVADVFAQHLIVRTSGKVRSVDWAVNRGSSKTLQLLAATTNNQLEMYNIPHKEKSGRSSKSDETPDYTRALAVELPGHRADIRSLALSSDDRMLASASNGGLKIWNVRTRACIRTFECGYALCCAFLPGDKVVVVGTKGGTLELFDVASAALLDTVAAHEGAVWSLQVHPDGRSMVSGGADKCARFWNFKIVQEEILGTTRTTPRLRLAQARRLEVADDILSLRFSPNARYLAVALLDNTVKVFFVDSLKLYLNLYGHKLPVLDMDISHDSKLIVTCSADKNVRIWGLDFGDCHKALFAHQDSVLQVAFVPPGADRDSSGSNGHHFFSASKDRTVKYWDGDKFEQIQRLGGHHGEIWALAVSRSGAGRGGAPPFIVTASHDKSIRVWEETDEQIFLEEEREKELEELYESTLTASLDQADDEDPEAGGDGEGAEVAAAGKQTSETLMAGERLQEALELGLEDLHVVREWEEARARDPSAALAPPQRHPVFAALGGLSAEEHVLGVLRRIRASALRDALLTLPFASVPALLVFLRLIGGERALDVPLACRVLSLVLRAHHRQLAAARTLRPELDALRAALRAALDAHRARLGANLAALRVVGLLVRDAGVSNYVDENWDDDEQPGVDGGGGKRKRAFVHVS